jgi:hypothetical protein
MKSTVTYTAEFTSAIFSLSIPKTSTQTLQHRTYRLPTEEKPQSKDQQKPKINKKTNPVARLTQSKIINNNNKIRK